MYWQVFIPKQSVSPQEELKAIVSFGEGLVEVDKILADDGSSSVSDKSSGQSEQDDDQG